MTHGRSSTTQMAELNNELMNQNTQLKGIMRTAQQTNTVSNNIQAELYNQRDKIEKNIEMNRNIKQGLVQSDRTTNQMRRRQFCVKIVLWIVIVMLFSCNVSVIIWKIQG